MHETAVTGYMTELQVVDEQGQTEQIEATRIEVREDIRELQEVKETRAKVLRVIADNSVCQASQQVLEVRLRVDR